jgi:hypothetical protein
VSPKLELVVRQPAQVFDIKQMPKLVGLQLVALLVEQQPVLLEQLVVLLVVQAHLQVLLVGPQRVEMQPVLKLLLVMILELVEFHLLVHQQQMLWLLLELLELLKLKLLVSMF